MLSWVARCSAGGVGKVQRGQRSGEGRQGMCSRTFQGSTLRVGVHRGLSEEVLLETRRMGRSGPGIWGGTAAEGQALSALTGGFHWDWGILLIIYLVHPSLQESAPLSLGYLVAVTSAWMSLVLENSLPC